MRVRQRIRIHAGCDEAGDMRHVDEEDCANRIGDLAHARPVHDLRIGAEAADQHLRLMLGRQALHLVVINHAGGIHAVLHGVEKLAADIDLGAVGEMAAMRQRHPEDGVARLQQRKVDGLVGLRAGMRLDIRVVGAE